MVAALCHDPAYASGTWCDESLGLYVGWVVRGESVAERMPLYNDQGDLVLAFSGDDFSRRSDACEGDGSSDLIRLAEEGPDFPKNLNGQFHGVLADRRKGSTTLFNDRYGMRRIYYHEAKDTFYFAAEAKAILAVRPELRSIDADGLGEFVSCGCTLENRTLFRGIRMLPPGSAWRFQQAGVVRKETYFDTKEWEEQPELDPESYYLKLREVFSEILPRYFGGSERVGISLTGGLDSRMIMAWWNGAPGSLPCYSFGGMYRESQDVAIARKVAHACKQEHEVISVGDDFLTKFPEYSERTVFLTDGCVEVKHAPDLYVNERAAQIAPVRVTGNYGGEVLRRIRAFRPIDSVPGLFQADFCAYIERAKKTYNGLLDGNALSFAAFRQAPWHHYGLLSLEQSQLSLRSPFLDNDLVKTVFRAPEQALTNDELCLRLIADGNAELLRIRTDRGVGGSLPKWAAAVQRACLEFTFKAEYAYDYGMPQSVARVDHALSRLHLEQLFLGRHKF
ncbi:MAG: asparagine synthase-related protein, partial [Acidobacteriaceae bacterium]|nr:asparagine synthase-related protein [Acidobacteriaceae bacterium]